ncbi:unnamed protein product [Peniophora sp. CBMAI 1063]|nr:unnamed protein product [Peniophora sp. CBMAI 1063]
MDALLSGGLDPASLVTLAASGGSPLDLSSILSAMSPSGDAMNFLSMMGSSGALSGAGFDPSSLLASLNGAGGADMSTWTDPTAVMNMFNQNSFSLQAQYQTGGDTNSDSGSGSSMLSNIGQDLVQDLVKKAAQYALDKLRTHGQPGQPAGMQHTSAPMHTPSHPPAFTQYAPSMPFNLNSDLSDLPSYTQPGHSFGQGFAQSPPHAQQSFPQSPPPMQQSFPQSPAPHNHHAHSQSYHAQSPSFGSGSPPTSHSWSSHIPDISVTFQTFNTPCSGPHVQPAQPVHQTPHPGSHSPRPSLSEWHPHLPHTQHAHSQSHTSTVDQAASSHHHSASHSSPTLHPRPPAHPSNAPSRPHSHSVSVSLEHNHAHSATNHHSLPPLHPNRPSPPRPTAHHSQTTPTPSTALHSASSASSSPSSLLERPPTLPHRPPSSPKPPPAHQVHTTPPTSAHNQSTSAHTPAHTPHKPTLHHAHTVPAPKLHAHTRPASIYGSHIGGNHTAHGPGHARTESTPNAHMHSHASESGKVPNGMFKSTRPQVEPKAGGMSRGQSLYASYMAEFEKAKEERG